MIRFVPFFVLSEHRIQDSQQFTHTGNQRHFFGFSCSKQTLVKGFYHWVKVKRAATRAAMYSPVLTPALPPKIVRRPRIVPESRFMGATPTSALISRRERLPSSGTSANNAAIVMAPMLFVLFRCSENSLTCF